MDGLTIVLSDGAGHQASHAAALAKGLAAHGVRTIAKHDIGEIRTKHVACWGWRKGAALRNAGHQVLVLERGYLGDRFAWTSLGWNGLNGHATVPPAPLDGGERFNRHFGELVRPWSPDGGYVLLVGQVPGDAALRGLSLANWYVETAARAREVYGLPVRFRPHPVAVQRGLVQPVAGAPVLGGDLQAALARAAVVVTFNSNTAVDALLAGKPTVATDSGSMAWSVAAQSLGPVAEPDRAAWLHGLAWRQFTLDEIQSGLAWSVVSNHEALAA